MAQRPEALKNFFGFLPVSAIRSTAACGLVYIRVSLIDQCGYCLQHHIASSKRVGLSREDWEGPGRAATLGAAKEGQRRWSTLKSLREFTQRQRCRLHPFEKHSPTPRSWIYTCSSAWPTSPTGSPIRSDSNWSFPKTALKPSGPDPARASALMFDVRAAGPPKLGGSIGGSRWSRVPAPPGHMLSVQILQ